MPLLFGLSLSKAAPVSARLRHAQPERVALRDSDVFGRLGGEEFCVLLSGQDEDKARALAGRLRTLLTAVPRLDGQLTVSAGITRMRAGETIAETLHRADLAMLQAKQSGRDTVCLAGETP